MASVDVVNARKAYGGVEVIHGVSLSIAEGEFVPLVGPSKSTLLRMIAGLESIKSARSNIDGRPCIYGIRPEHLAIGGELKAEVSVVDPTGSETQVFAKVGNHPIVAVQRDRISARPREATLLSSNLDAVHLFDAESGKRLQ